MAEPAPIGAPLDIAGARSVHLVGIGGAAMTPLATILLQMGVRVSGSDVSPSAGMDTLRSLGARIYPGHHADQVADCECLVVSSAIPEENPEIQAARSRGIPVVKHSVALGCLMRTHRGVAIAGTHGKTTTSALAAWTLDAGGLDPTFHVGSELLNYGLSGRLGSGDVFVAEADEFDRRFLDYDPEIAIVTGVEPDHLDYFGTAEQLVGAFEAFAARVRPGGAIIVSADNPVSCSLVAPQATRMTYGFAGDADWRVLTWHPASPTQSELFLRTPDGHVEEIEVQLLGRHNAANLAAVVALGVWLSVPMDALRAGLAQFKGTRRRFEVIGSAADVTVVDDYAHHPTAVRATLAAARAHFGLGRPTATARTSSDERNGPPDRGSRPTIWAVFQPHTAHRTSSLFDAFARAFSDADHVIVTPTYRPPGREVHEDDPTVRALVAAMPHPDARALSPAEAVETILSHARSGDLVLVMGAGDIWTIESTILSGLQQRATRP